MAGSYIKSKHMWKGAFLVTAAAFLGKVLSALYRVPYQNMAGDQGLYVYQQVYPFYGTAMILSMYGFPVVLSKIIGENNIRRSAAEVKATVYAAFILLLAVHGLLFLALAAGSPVVAGWMGDERLSGLILLVSPALLFIPVISAVRGYYQGIGEMHPTAGSHLLEQLIRVTAILSFTAFVVWNESSAYAAGRAAVIGSVLGSAGGAGYLLWIWFQAEKTAKISGEDVVRRIKDMNITFIMHGALVSAGAMIFLLYQWVDAFSVVRVMTASGMEAEQAKSLKGVLDRGQPLLQFGTVLATSFAMAVVPMIQREEQKGTRKLSRQYAGLALRLTFFIGGSAALGLIMIAEPVNRMLFENEAGTGALQIMAASLIFSGWIMVTAAVMQGYNYFLWPVFFLLLGVMVKGAGNIMLLPLFGIKGAAAATVFGMGTTSACNLWFIYRNNLVQFPGARWIMKAVCAFTGMVLLQFVLNYGYDAWEEKSRVSSTVFSLTAAGFGVMMQLWLMIKLSLFTKEERRLLPVVNKLERKEKDRED